MKNNNILKQKLFLSLSIFLIILNISSVHSVPLQNNKITESDSTIIDRIQKDSTILKILFEFIALSDSCGYSTDEYPFIRILEKKDSTSYYWEVKLMDFPMLRWYNCSIRFIYCGEIKQRFILYGLNVPRDINVPYQGIGIDTANIKQTERLRPIHNILLAKLEIMDNCSDFNRLSSLTTEMGHFRPLRGVSIIMAVPKMKIYFDDQRRVKKILYNYGVSSGTVLGYNKFLNFRTFIKQLKESGFTENIVLNIDSFPTLKKYN